MSYLGKIQAEAQTTKGFSWELGTMSGLRYETSLTPKRWTLEGRAGLAFHGNPIGFYSMAELAPRYHFSSVSKSEAVRTGAYWGVRLAAYSYKAGIYLGSVYRPNFDSWDWSIIPNFGWIFPVGDNAGVRLGIGIAFDFVRDRWNGGWVLDSRYNNDIVLPIEIGYTQRF